MPMGKRKEKTSTCRGKQGLFELLRDKRKKNTTVSIRRGTSGERLWRSDTREDE